MDLFITGIIHDLSTLRERIENATEDVVLHIDSPGGEAFEGLETAHCIANAKCKVTAPGSMPIQCGQAARALRWASATLPTVTGPCRPSRMTGRRGTTVWRAARRAGQGAGTGAWVVDMRAV